jgi:hypothetical protein
MPWPACTKSDDARRPSGGGMHNHRREKTFGETRAPYPITP